MVSVVAIVAGTLTNNSVLLLTTVVFFFSFQKIDILKSKGRVVLQTPTNPING